MSFVNMISKGIFILLFLVCGCMNNPPGAKEKIIAKINNFTLTVEDFKGEANPLLMKSSYWKCDYHQPGYF